MSIVIDNRALEAAIEALAARQTVPTRKRLLVEAILQLAVDKCAAQSDPEAWARDAERDVAVDPNDLEAGLLRSARGLRDTLRSGERIENAYTVRKVARASDGSDDKGDAA